VDPEISAVFDETLAGEIAIGTCAPPLYGRPQRRCLANGEWEDHLLRNPCVRT